ncbi:MAG: type IVB secretion system protein IcmH/DotU [Nitrospira sp.]|nr:type IVB secretion system protein IcmH/DotU [Nitrospira sp.]MDH4243228.1 type IVB secretion system protein IcmH/DotU [Nitrospira sp.]MDH4356023.1 type IVB secretion system protein IcmH/DotU [Nitrospira sp.]MDH5317426.1 type IVB secretion system protein IcmH/DotU [Nitrospira sp.]
MSEERTKRITEVFSDLLVLGSYLKETRDIGSPDHLRTRLHHLFQQADEAAKKNGIPSDTVAHARYAVAAYLDEMIINSQWTYREQWASRPLQYDFFGEFVAGEGFFRRLDTIRRGSPLDANLLEVYGLCLIFGFEGQYRLHERERLRGLIEDVTREVQAKRGDALELSPHGRRPEELMELVKRELPAWVVLATSAGIVLLFYLALAFVINQDVGQVLDQLKKILQESAV